MSVDQQPVRNVSVQSLSRDVVEAIAPQELPILGVYLAAYERDPAIAAMSHRAGDEDTGFGVGDATAIAPYVVSVASAAIALVGQQMLEMVAAPARERGWARIVRGFDRLRRRHRPVAAVAVDQLSAEQLRQVRAAAVRKARELGLPAQRADVLADAVVGALAVRRG